MEENTSKVLAADANLAATFLNSSDAGTSLFVINLCASMAPMMNVAKSLPGLETYRLYQVTRREDGRTRYRLRLGFFTSEADAEAILGTVRDTYPTAFTACLCDEDRKFTRGFIPEPPRAPKIQIVDTKPAPASSVTAPKPAPATSVQRAKAPTAPAAAAPKQPAPPPVPAEDINEIELSWDPPELGKINTAAPQTPAPQIPVPQTIAPAFKTQEVIKATPVAAAAKPTAQPATKPRATAETTRSNQRKVEAPSQARASIELTLEQEPAAAPKKPEPVASAEPFRVSRGAEIPATSLTLETTPTPQTPAASKVASTSTKPAAPAAPKPPLSTAAEMSRLKAAHASAPASIKAAVTPGAQTTAKLPDLDSTQTIRALTNDELANESQDKWFSIQLAASDQPVNLDAMPRLDIFEAYRLYSVALAGSGKITHSLRIGFFREEVSAEAVCGYLKTFFNSPSVVRISIAEHARFKDPPAPKPTPKTAEVLDLSHARDRGAKPIPTVTMEVESPRFDPNATGSFKTSSTGMHKALSTGAHKALTATGTHRALGATGTHKTLKAASKTATPPTKRSAPLTKSSATGKHRSLQPKKSLTQQLLDEAREVELSESGIRKLPKNDSLLSKMFGRRPK